VDLDNVADELYGLALAEFTSARDLKVSDARLAGDRELAMAIKGLRRPTTGAWLANMLARESPQKISDLLKLGSTMRRAQKNLEGDDLRRLSRERQELVSELVVLARSRAGVLGSPVNDSTLRELTGTFEAALANTQDGEALKTGRLTTGLRYSGFGSDLSDTAAVVPAKSVSHPKPKPDSKRPPAEDLGLQREEAADNLKRAQRSESLAQKDLQECKRSLEIAKRAAAQAGRQVQDAEKRIKRLREAQEKADTSLRNAETECNTADAALLSLREQVALTKSAVDKLR